MIDKNEQQRRVVGAIGSEAINVVENAEDGIKSRGDGGRGGSNYCIMRVTDFYRFVTET